MDNGHQTKLVVDIAEADLEKEVRTSDVPVLAMFWAAWSQPCQILGRVLEEVAEACARKAKIFKINADESPELSMWYEIQSIPTLLYFVNGSVRAKLVGTATKEAVLAKLSTIQAGNGRSPKNDNAKNEHDTYEV